MRIREIATREDATGEAEKRRLDGLKAGAKRAQQALKAEKGRQQIAKGQRAVQKAILPQGPR